MGIQADVSLLTNQQLPAIVAQFGLVSQAFYDDLSALGYSGDMGTAVFSGAAAQQYQQALTAYGSDVTKDMDLIYFPMNATRNFQGELLHLSDAINNRLFFAATRVIDIALNELRIDGAFLNGDAAIVAALNDAVNYVLSHPTGDPYEDDTQVELNDRAFLVNWTIDLQNAFITWVDAMHYDDISEIDAQFSSIIDPALYNQYVAGFGQRSNGYFTLPIGMTETIPALPIPDDERQRIMKDFSDPTIQQAMLQLAQTPTGQQFLPYLLYMQETVPGGGFLTFKPTSPGQGAYTAGGGYISLSIGMQGDTYHTANAIIHEAVESYMATQGYRTAASQHTDYVAEWYSGKFTAEIHGIDPQLHSSDPDPLGSEANQANYGAYQKSFLAWSATPDGTVYSNEPVTSGFDEATHGKELPGKVWPGDVDLNPKDWTDVSHAPNPFNLDINQLLEANDLRVYDSRSLSTS